MFKVFPGYNETPMTELAMQFPMFGHANAFVPDWNDDGVLDLWHHNHFLFSRETNRWSDPSMGTYGPAKHGGCFTDWDAVLRDADTGTWYPANNGEGFLEWTDKRRLRCLDVHSTTFLDFDGDGINDLYLTTGGGRGRGESADYDNVVFWGTKTNTTLGYKLSGGQETALTAGLEGRNKDNLNERGRHQYWLDVDGDGLLDVITLNQERSDKHQVPGRLNRNIGNRTFEEVIEAFEEFASVALLTDLNGDGFAREMIVMSECDKPNKKTRTSEICKTSPIGTASVYSLDPHRFLVRESINKGPLVVSKSVATADFDNDGLADIAILYTKWIDFHMSSSRQKKCQPIVDDVVRRECLMKIDERDYKLDLRPYCGVEPSAGMRLADFNLDGRLDLLIVCRTPGRHAILELLPNGEWTKIKGSNGRVMGLGAIKSRLLMKGGKDFCNGIPISDGDVRPTKVCEDRRFTGFAKEDCKNVTYNKQFYLCNRYAKNETALALGATVADLDNDGFVDLIVSHKYGSTVMFRNTLGDLGNNNSFLAIRVDKKAGAAASIGAVVKLTARNMGPNNSKKVTQLRVVSSLSHLADAEGGSDHRIIFGLGSTGSPLKLEVQWPHCCKPFVVGGLRLKKFLNSMDTPYLVPAPKDCDKSCFTKPPDDVESGAS